MEFSKKSKKKICKGSSYSEDSASSSDKDLDYESIDKRISKHRYTKSFVTEESYTSLSEDDSNESLGLLSEDLLELTWDDESGTDELFSNFEKFDVRLPHNFKHEILPKECSNLEPKCEKIDVSPIPSSKECFPIDLTTLESTPKVRHIDQEKSTSYKENILNKTIKISDVPKEASYSLEESDEKSNSDNVLNVTCDIEKQGDFLNKTFQSLNILNKTLPSVTHTDSNISSGAILTEIENRFERSTTLSESPKDTNKTILFTCDQKNSELPVEAKYSQETLSRTVTKRKFKKNDGIIPTKSSSTSWTTINSSTSFSGTSYYPVSSDSTSQTNFLQTGAKVKVSKTAKKNPKMKRNSSPVFDFADSDSSEIKTIIKSKSLEPKKNLCSTNRDVKLAESSSAFDATSSPRLGHTDPKVSPHNIATVSRGNFASKRILKKKTSIDLSFQKIKESPSQKEDESRCEEMLLKNENYLQQHFRHISKLKGYADHKLSTYRSIQEIRKIKNKRERLEIPTQRLMTVPCKEQRRQQNIISRLPQRTSSQIGSGRGSLHHVEKHAIGSQMKRYEDRHVHPLPIGRPAEIKRYEDCHVPWLPIGRSGEMERYEDRHVPPLPVGRPVEMKRYEDRLVPPLPVGRPAEIKRYEDRHVPLLPIGRPAKIERYEDRHHVPPLPIGRPGETHRRSETTSRMEQRAVGSQAIFGDNPFDAPIRGRSAIPKKTPSAPHKPHLK